MVEIDLATQWQNCFLEIIQEPCRAARLKDAASLEALVDWTTQLAASVVRSCVVLGWHPAAKEYGVNRLPQPGQEYLGLDVMAFPAHTDVDHPTCWPLPVAVFELENSTMDDRVVYSLWKVLCVRVDLRIVLAYRPNWEMARQIVAMLEKEVVRGLTTSQRDTLGGQTLLVLGSRGEGEAFPGDYFKVWKLDANLGHFIEI